MERTEEEKLIYNACPEFPFFGAKYPDARCVDGNLHDMDACDEEGRLYEAGEYNPCPFCRTDEYVKRYLDEESGITKEVILEDIEALRKRYS